MTDRRSGNESRHQSLMVNKFFSMLLGGTLTMVVVSVMLMSDSVIAGIFVGSDAVAGITLVTPVYFISAFCGSVVSLGIPIIYGKAMGKFDKAGAVIGGPAGAVVGALSAVDKNIRNKK